MLWFINNNAMGPTQQQRQHILELGATDWVSVLFLTPPAAPMDRRMPHVSDRGLRYVLYRLTKGSRVAAASYLADRCAGAGSALKRLEAEAEACEQRELEDSLKAEDASRRAEEARRIDKEEREALKGKIVGRYADEVRALVRRGGGWARRVFGRLGLSWWLTP